MADAVVPEQRPDDENAADALFEHINNPTLFSPAAEPKRRVAVAFRCQCGAVYSIGGLLGEGYAAIFVALATCGTCLREYTVRFSEESWEAEVTPVDTDEDEDAGGDEDDPKDH